MNCYEVQAKLDRYVESELAADEQAAVENHLETCSACRQRLTNLRQMMALLHQIPSEAPPPDLVGRIVARVEARIPRHPGYWLWLHTAAVGFGILFSAYLLSALGYQTLLAWQQGGAGQFISLLFNDPALIAHYPAESLYAILEALPVAELALTLGSSLVVLLLVEQLLGVLAGWAQPRLNSNGNHSGRGVA
ncbi:MAG: zf-HC2 domain-containing protein [Anaerolineae bacterium]|nr:zf-HC2 domain-containing protein [Anaerolineae bacterium]